MGDLGLASIIMMSISVALALIVYKLHPWSDSRFWLEGVFSAFRLATSIPIFFWLLSSGLKIGAVSGAGLGFVVTGLWILIGNFVEMSLGLMQRKDVEKYLKEQKRPK